jgi:hypothetical protein
MIVTVVIKIIMLFVRNKHQINNDAGFLSKTICISLFLTAEMPLTYSSCKEGLILMVSRDSSFGVATGYRLDDWASIPGKQISTASSLALGHTKPPIQWAAGALSPGVKR